MANLILVVSKTEGASSLSKLPVFLMHQSKSEKLWTNQASPKLIKIWDVLLTVKILSKKQVSSLNRLGWRAFQNRFRKTITAFISKSLMLVFEDQPLALHWFAQEIKQAKNIQSC